MFPHSVWFVILESAVSYKNEKDFRLDHFIDLEKRNYRTRFGFCKDDIVANSALKESVTPYLIRYMKNMKTCCSKEKKEYVFDVSIKNEIAQKVSVEMNDEVGKCLENALKNKKISIESVNNASFQLKYRCQGKL